jgi:hypothetical protein
MDRTFGGKGLTAEKTAGMYLRELYGYDYDHALDYRDGPDRERGPELTVMAPDTGGNAREHKKAV